MIFRLYFICKHGLVAFMGCSKSNILWKLGHVCLDHPTVFVLQFANIVRDQYTTSPEQNSGFDVGSLYVAAV